MRIENTSRIPTKELKPVLTQVMKSAPLGRARTWLQGKDGLYIKVCNAKYSRVRGRIYPEAIQIHRQGKPIAVRGYIKLYIFDHTDLAELSRTFAHELSHFKDWYDHCTIFDTGYIVHQKIPWGREKRARAFADRVINQLNSIDKMNKLTYPVKDDIEQGQRMCESTGWIGLNKCLGYQCGVCGYKIYAKLRHGRRNYKLTKGAIRQHIKSHFPIIK